MKPSGTKVYIFFTVLTILLFSCQNDENEIILNNQESLLEGSELAGLMLRMSQYPTSVDNIIDNTNCFAVNLPVTVIANGQQMVIASGADYVLIENVFNASSTDVDTMEIVFPVTVTYADYTQQEITSREQWDTAINCSGNAILGELSCIRFNYPVSISTYSTVNQIADVVIVDNNFDLYKLISSISEENLEAIAFPIRIIRPDGGQDISNNNEELLDAINEYAPQCDMNAASILDDIIVTGTWHVSFYAENSVDMTNNYFGYTFSFNNDGSSLVIKETLFVPGTWDVYNESSALKLNLAFDGEVLDGLEEDWEVTEYTATTMKLMHVSTGNSATDVLHLIKN
jgi:hypothetical protein